MDTALMIYRVGLAPAACIYLARAVWLAPRQSQHNRRTVIALCMFCAVTWPLALPMGVVVKVSEWTGRDAALDRSLQWAEHTARKLRR